MSNEDEWDRSENTDQYHDRHIHKIQKIRRLNPKTDAEIAAYLEDLRGPDLSPEEEALLTHAIERLKRSGGGPLYREE